MMLRYRGLLAAGMTLCSLSLFAQEQQIPYHDSRELLLQGIDLHDKGKYKDALALYRQVPEGDTNYVLSLYEQSMTLLADSSFAESKAMSLKGLRQPLRSSNRELLLTLGHAYDYLGMRDSAMYYYDSLMRVNPYDNQPHYEKGVTYYHEKEYDKAMKCFEESLMLNPYHYRSHLMLGDIYLQQGRLAEAYLAFCTALLNTKDKAQAGHVVGLLDVIAANTDEAAKAYNEKNKQNSDPAFDDIDQIINSRLALSKDYKYESDFVGDKQVNTLHVILEKLEYDKSDDNFAMQYYVPMYKQLYDDKQFDLFVLGLYSGYGFEKIDKKAEQQKKAIEESREALVAYMNRINATGVLNYAQRKTAPQRYIMSGSEHIFLVGNIKNTEPLSLGEGPVDMYKNGVLLARGSYNKEGNKEGNWKFWHDNGQLKTDETFSNGDLDGTATKYRSNGTLEEVDEFKKGKQTAEKDYSYSGILDTYTTVSGTTITVHHYFPNGQEEYVNTQVDGKFNDGIYKNYYDDGTVSDERSVAKGGLNGTYKEYYRSGKLKGEYVYADGKKDGPMVTYFENGKVEMKAGYKEGKLEGPYEEYNDEGQLIAKGSYHKNKKTDEDFFYAPDGRVYEQISYKNDAPVNYQYTGADGKTISAENTGHSFDKLVVYDENGIVTNKIPYEDGKANGTVESFRHSGAPSKVATYKDDVQEGKSVSYHSNGKVSEEEWYKNGNNDGYYTGYLECGVKSAEGWFKEGVKQGIWRYYHPNGKMSAEEFWLNNTSNGPVKIYKINGEADYTTYYDKDMLYGLVQYDSNGRVYWEQQYPQGNGTYTMKYYSGKPCVVNTLRNGEFNGPSTNYLPDGKPWAKGYYKNGLRDSSFVSYFNNGVKAQEGSYSHGKREGAWRFYYENGDLMREENYKDGQQEGIENMYDAGILTLQRHYHNGDLTGEQLYLGEEKKVAGVLIFKNGLLTGYTYEDKSGKRVPVVPIAKGTGAVTTYYANGNKGLEFTFKQNVKDGKQQQYYANGQVMDERTLNMNIVEGPYKEYYADGKLFFEGQQHNDELDGVQTMYAPDGKVINTHQFIAGTEHGLATYTDPKTGKTTKTVYRYGDIMSVE